MLQRWCGRKEGGAAALTGVGIFGRQAGIAGRDLRRCWGALLRVLLVANLVVQLQLRLLFAVRRDGHPFVDLHCRVADGHPFLFPVTHLVHGLHDAFDVILGPAAGLCAHTA